MTQVCRGSLAERKLRIKFLSAFNSAACSAVGSKNFNGQMLSLLTTALSFFGR